ncbi:MAG: Fur family transcriptional regulator [Acidimicrobiales bacterium]
MVDELAAADERTHRDVAFRLARSEQRYTRQRRVMIDALASIARPATIGEILDALPDLPVSTAYRNLSVLAEAGIVRRVNGTDEFGRFELAEEVSGHHHHHAVCSQCGLIIDATSSPRLEAALADTARAIAQENGFDVSDHRLELVGRCSTCAERGRT